MPHSQVMSTSLKNSRLSRALPEPRATVDNGSSVTVIGRLVSSRIKRSRFLSRAPPPVRIIPRSTISADSSGGVCSRAILTVSTMASICSEIAIRISSESMDKIFGIPEARSRPLTYMVSKFCGSGYALPMVVLITSAVRSPISRLYLRLIYWMMAESILSPATRTDRL